MGMPKENEKPIEQESLGLRLRSGLPILQKRWRFELSDELEASE